MIVHESTVGGTVYLEYSTVEMALPEAERVAFDYKPLTNRQKVDLLHKTMGSNGAPNGADVCIAAVTKIRNLFDEGGKKIDTMDRLLAVNDTDNGLAYMIMIVGSRIWYRQEGQEVGLKN